LKEVFAPYLKKIGAGFKDLIRKPRLRLPGFVGQIKLGKLPKLAISKFPNIARTLLVKLNKKLILVLALIFFLALGFFIAQLQEEKELKERKIILNEIQEKVNRAESYLILKTPRAEKEANLLLKESWEEISQLSKIVSNLPRDFQSQVFSLKDEVSKTLFYLNKLETIEEPKLFFDFKERDFIPQKMIFFKGEVYFFSPHLQNLFRVDKNAQGEIIEVSQKFNLAALSDKAILFFSKPNQLTLLKGREMFSAYLEEPYPYFSFDDFTVFRNHLYFLDKNLGEIIRYPYLGNLKWGSAKLWLAREEKKAIEARSLAVDGSIWLISHHQKNGRETLSQYRLGRLREKVVLEIFPEPKEFKKIFTSATLPYLYLLEPIQKRIVVIDKKGEIIKQFQSQKFDNLLDFGVSDDGKIIWLLNGLKVYQIQFSH